MTATKIYMLTCDGCGVTIVPMPETLTTPVARGQAGHEGWAYEHFPVKFGLAPSRDFCPTCVQSGVRGEVVTELVYKMLERGQRDA